MNAYKKISGFTIIELLVVMAISSIIMSLSVFIYLQIQRTVITNVNNYSKVNNVLLILKKLEVEIRESDRILLNENELLISDNLGNKISYELNDLFNNPTDSLTYNNYLTNLSYLNEPGTNLVNQISFDLTSNSTDTLHIFLSKEYSPYILMNHFKGYSIEH